MRVMFSQIPDVRFIDLVRVPKIKLTARCGCCGSEVCCEHTPPEISAGLTGDFDVTLIQNVDSVNLIAGNKKRCVVRLGGIVMDDNFIKSKYDDVLRGVGAVIATNNALCGLGIRVNPNTVMLPNGVDLEMFRPVHELRPERFTAGFAGNIWGGGLNYKGYQYFVDMAVRLMTQGVSAKKLLHKYPDEQSPSAQVEHGKMPEMFYHRIHCLVLPSLGEGCSNVTAEALACGVPVLITKVGFHGETLVDGENCLFIERDAEQIAGRVMELKNNPELWTKLSVNGRKFAEEHHDVRKIAQEYKKIFVMVSTN